MSSERFSKDSLIIDILRTHPETRAIFATHGMGCIGCMGSEAETIENGARMHGINVQCLLDELNIIIEKGRA